MPASPAARALKRRLAVTLATVIRPIGSEYRKRTISASICSAFVRAMTSLYAPRPAPSVVGPTPSQAESASQARVHTRRVRPLVIGSSGGRPTAAGGRRRARASGPVVADPGGERPDDVRDPEDSGARWRV